MTSTAGRPDFPAVGPPSPGVKYRPHLESGALRQMHGPPEHEFDMLVTLLARICDDPYDPVFKRTERGATACRDVGDFGFIVFASSKPLA